MHGQVTDDHVRPLCQKHLKHNVSSDCPATVYASSKLFLEARAEFLKLNTKKPGDGGPCAVPTPTLPFPALPTVPPCPTHASTHACLHTCIHDKSQQHAHTNTCIRAHMHKCTCAYMHTCIHKASLTSGEVTNSHCCDMRRQIADVQLRSVETVSSDSSRQSPRQRHSGVKIGCGCFWHEHFMA